MSKTGYEKSNLLYVNFQFLCLGAILVRESLHINSYSHLEFFHASDEAPYKYVVLAELFSCFFHVELAWLILGLDTLEKYCIDIF